MKKNYLLFFAILCLNIANAQWVQKQSMPDNGRYAGISMVINGKAYVGLGKSPSNVNLKDFWEYNPVSNIWTKKADYPGGGSYSAISFSINGKGYVGLGATNSVATGFKDLWEYDPVSNSWVQKANLPGNTRYGASCFVVGDTAFIGTGSYNDANNYCSDMWMYIPQTNTWSQLASFPGGKRNAATAFTIGKYGYMGAGLSGIGVFNNDFWKYNKSTNTWTAIQSMPGAPRGCMVNFVLNNRAFVGTGMDAINNDYNDLYSYHSSTNSWDTLLAGSGSFLARDRGIAFLINNTGYIGTGYSANGLFNDLWAISLDIFNGIYEDSRNENLSIYPNPSSNELLIDYTLKCKGDFELYDICGVKIKIVSLDYGLNRIEINEINNGFYFYCICDTKGNKMKTGKLVIQK